MVENKDLTPVQGCKELDDVSRSFTEVFQLTCNFICQLSRIPLIFLCVSKLKRVVPALQLYDGMRIIHIREHASTNINLAYVKQHFMKFAELQ